MAPKHTAYISPVYTLSIFTPDSLCISDTPILFTWLDSELGHCYLGPTPGTHLHIPALTHPSAHTCTPPRHLPVIPPDGIYLPKMAISLCPL